MKTFQKTLAAFLTLCLLLSLPALAAAPDWAEYQQYVNSFAAAGAPTPEDAASMEEIILGCETMEDLLAAPELGVFFAVMGAMDYDAWTAAGKPAEKTAEASGEASGAPSGEAGAASSEMETASGLRLVLPDDAESEISETADTAQAMWTWQDVEVTERVSRSAAEPAMDSATLTALSGVDFTGLATQSKELVVGGRCPGYMEFCRGAVGAVMWYDAELGLVYTLSLDPVYDPKNLGDTAELISPLQSDAQEDSMIVIDGCAIAHDLTATPVEEIGDEADYLWKVVDGYGITYTDENGRVWGIYRAGQAGVFEIVVSADDSPSPWSVGDQIWVGGSKLVELCVQDGKLTHVLTDELQSGPAFDVEIR